MSEVKLASIAQRLEAVEFKRTGNPIPTSPGNSLEDLVARIERVSMALAEGGSLARLANVLNRLLKVEARLAPGASGSASGDLAALVAGVERAVDSIAVALGKPGTSPAPKPAPIAAAPVVAPVVAPVAASVAPTVQPTPAATPTPAVAPTPAATAQPTHSAVPSPAKAPAPAASAAPTPAKTVASTAQVGDKIIPVSSAPPITSDGLRTNPKLAELQGYIDRVKSNDASLKELNLNNNDVCNHTHGIAIADALESNTNLKSLQMVNCKLTTPAAEAFARALRVNKTLELLNLESNEFTGAGIKAIAEALPSNTTLLELKLTNQRSLTGTEAERALAIAFETNMTITKFVLPIKDPGSRNSIDRAMSRNAELARKKKMAKK